MRPAICLAALLATTALAYADRREASVHAHAIGGAVTMDDDASTSGSGTGALAGLAVRASYATRNAWQYDTQLTLGYGRASFDAGQFLLGGGTPMTVPFTVSSQLARLDAGVTLRLGVRWIPTVRLAVGAQAVRRGSPVATAGGFEFTGDDTAPPSLSANLIGSATVGLDYRMSRRLIVGAAVGATTAVPGVGDSWREATITVHAARYWYPRW